MYDCNVRLSKGNIATIGISTLLVRKIRPPAIFYFKIFTVNKVFRTHIYTLTV